MPAKPPPCAEPALTGPPPAESTRKGNRRSERSPTGLLPIGLRTGPTNSARTPTRSSSRAGHRSPRPLAAATPLRRPSRCRARARTEAYRTRCRGTAPCPRASVAPPPAAASPPPTEFRRGTAATRPAARRAAEKTTGASSNSWARTSGSDLGERFRQQAFQYDPEIRAVQRIGQRELHETFEVAWEVADVVPLFLGRQFHGQYAAAFLAHELDRVRQLDLIAFVRLHAAYHVENHRRENVPAGNRQIARRVLGRRLLHQVHHAENVV